MVKIIASKLCISIGGFDVEHTVGNAQQRHVEGAATEVENQCTAHRTAVEAIGQCRSGGFIENPLDVDASEATGIPGGLTLCVVEVSRNGDHRGFHLFAQVSGGVVHQFAQDAGNQLFRGILPFGLRASDSDVPLIVGTHRVRHRERTVIELIPSATNKTLEVGKGVSGVENQLSSRRLSHQKLIVFGVPQHRRRGARAFGIGNHHWPPGLQNSHDGIGGTQVDSDDPAHKRLWGPLR